jgi:hypothetical protein
VGHCFQNNRFRGQDTVGGFESRQSPNGLWKQGRESDAPRESCRRFRSPSPSPPGYHRGHGTSAKYRRCGRTQLGITLGCREDGIALVRGSGGWVLGHTQGRTGREPPTRSAPRKTPSGRSLSYVNSDDPSELALQTENVQLSFALPAPTPPRVELPGMRLIRRFIYWTRLLLQADLRDVFNLAEVATRKQRAEKRYP